MSYTQRKEKIDLVNTTIYVSLGRKHAGLCTKLLNYSNSTINYGVYLLLHRRYLAFNFIDFDSLCRACQISKSRQNIRASGQTSTIKISCKVQVGSVAVVAQKYLRCFTPVEEAGRA